MATTPTGTPKKTGLKYTYRDGEGYGDWYRANTGMEWDGTYLNAKPEGMSDVDWMQGTMLQQFEGNKGAADATRDQTKAGLGDIYKQQTSAAQQSFNSMANQYNTQMKGELEYAGVLHERMKKYLPQQMRAAGMGNMGIAQTAGANAAARHMSTRAGIIGQNQASMNELSRTHGERQAAIDAEYKKGMMAADTAYNDRMTELSDQRYADEMALFGQTVKEKEDEQAEYYAAGVSGIKEAKTREEALALAEQMKPYVSESQYNVLVVEANNRGNKLDGDAEEDLDTGYDKTEGKLLDLISGATTREEAQAYLDAAIADGSLPEERRAYLEGKIANKFGAKDAADVESRYNKTAASMDALIAQGKTADALEADLQSYIDSGSIRPEDAEHYKKVIAGLKDTEAKIAGDTKAAEAKSLILEETTAEGRKATLEKYKGQISEDAYTSLSNLIDTLDRNQNAADAAAGQQKASEQLTSLFAAGASSADIRTTYDKMLTAGTITEADKPYWDTMLSTLEKAERDKAEGLISAEQAAQADFARDMMGYALDPITRAEILEECGAWLESGKITQSQYDAIAAYAGVLDSNDAYLKASEEEKKAMEEHDALVEDIISYIVSAANNYDEANQYYTDFVNGGEEFSEADKRSIELALKMRQNMDDKDALLKMTEAQSKAYDRCVNMMGLYDTVEGQRKALEMYKDDLAPEVYEEFKAVLDVLAEDPETKAAEEEQAREDEAKAKGYGSAAEYDAAVLEGKEYVEYEGASYKINGEAVSIDDMDAKEKQEFTRKLEEIGFVNPYGKDIPNGITVKIPKKMAGPMGLEYNATYIFYNGEWYPALTMQEKKSGGRGGSF